jgi:hypothetical protein
MPMFIDRHQLADVPSAVRQRMDLEAAQGLVDEHGVQPRAHWLSDGVIYCVARAPSQEAFCQHHADRGLPCDGLHPVMGLRESHPLSLRETRIVRATIAKLWPADRVAT